MTITAIGFAGKYYTLWNISEESKPLGNGCNYVVTHYIYIKNISFDKETAIAKYPNAIIDENLRGKTISWKTEKKVWDNVDVFRFGKYEGTKINDNEDTEYLEWYWGEVYDEHKKYVENILISRGYEVRTNEYKDYYGNDCTSVYLVDPETIKRENELKIKLEAIEEKLKKHEPIEVTFDRNLNEDGEVRVDDIIYKFNEFKEFDYKGWPYGLPMINGKAKRIKNKSVRILDYTYNKNYSLTIQVSKFEITK